MNLPILALISMGALFVQTPATTTTTTIRKADDTAQTTWTYSFYPIDYREGSYDVSIPVDGTFTISYLINCDGTPAWNSSGQGMQIYKNSEYLQLVELSNNRVNYSSAINLVDGSTFMHTDSLTFRFVASYVPEGSSLTITLYLGGYYDGYADGFNAGNAGAEGQFEAGYNQGYNAGINESGTKVNGLDWIKLALSQVNEILQIEILPGIRLSYLVAIPLIFSLLYFILGWFK